jgi:hypothetical protein
MRTPRRCLDIQKKRSFFNLDVTYNQAVEQLAARDPAEVAARAGVVFDEAARCFHLPFLSDTYRVHFPGGKITGSGGGEASLYLGILMLHYLAGADGTPLAGRWISFRHLPGGEIYVGPFQRRAVDPFLKAFGGDPEGFVRAAAELGGHRAAGSGVGMVIPALPRVPLYFILWPGDEELPGTANILFDASAASYLPTEDYAHLPVVVTGAMKALRK